MKEFVYAVFGVVVPLPAGSDGKQCVNCLAVVLEDIVKYEGKLVRIYKKLIDAQKEVACSNAGAFRRASEGLHGSHEGQSSVYYVKEIEVIESWD